MIPVIECDGKARDQAVEGLQPDARLLHAALHPSGKGTVTAHIIVYEAHVCSVLRLFFENIEHPVQENAVRDDKKLQKNKLFRTFKPREDIVKQLRTGRKILRGRMRICGKASGGTQILRIPLHGLRQTGKGQIFPETFRAGIDGRKSLFGFAEKDPLVGEKINDITEAEGDQ